MAILNRTHTIAHDIVAPAAETVDREACWPEAGLRALQAAGLGGLVIPEQYGGAGLGFLALARVCEILGQACSSTAICFGMHCVGSAVLAAKATPYQHERYLTPICKGAHLTTLALSEPGTGVHFYIPQTRLNRVPPDHLRITGTKCFVTNGGYCDSYVVSTVAAGSQPGEFSCVAVTEGRKGMAWGAPWNGLGMRGNASRTLELKEVLIPEQDLLGEEGDQIWYVFNIVAPYFLIAMAGTYLGLAQAALDTARQHLTGRFYSHSGSSPGHNAILQHRLGTLWSMVERSRRLIYHAATEADEEGADMLFALCAAKADVAGTAIHVVNEAMTLTGGIAYRDGSRLDRLLRDARAVHVMSPSTDILYTWIGRGLLDQPLLGE